MEREYKITKLEKNRQRLKEDNVTASKMIMFTSALVTIMSYGNFGLSISNVREFITSLLSIGLAGVTIGSILYLVKTLSEMSDIKANIEKINIESNLSMIDSINEEKDYLITKRVGYNKNIAERKKVAIKSGLLAVALHVAIKMLVVPFGETLDYGSVEKYLVGIVTAFGNVFKYISFSSMVMCLLDMANLQVLKEKLDKILNETNLEERGQSR